MCDEYGIVSAEDGVALLADGCGQNACVWCNVSACYVCCCVVWCEEEGLPGVEMKGNGVALKEGV